MSAPDDTSNPRKVYFVSLGCPKNQVDTEVMLGIVRDEGQVVVDSPEDADTLVVNTCAFIDSAKAESVQTTLEMAQFKTRHDQKLVMTGCLSQRYADDLATEMPEVDHFLGSSDMLGLREVLRGKASRNAVSKLSLRSYLYDHTAPRRTIGAKHSNFVKIAEGCDRPCAFCIIPALRGPQRSRTVYSLAEEVQQLVSEGTKEICLVAQDLTKYGTDLEERGMAPANLEQLLDALGEIAGLEWIRLHYAYPTATTLGLLQRISDHPKVATYLDVPFQHIDSDVLKHMRRGYGEKQIRDLVDQIRKQKNHIWLRTTMLVGHPGESEAAYERLRDFIEEGQIDHLGVFPWSKEDGTASAILPKRVDPERAQERADELMAIQAELRLPRQKAMIGQTLRVMIDGVSDESEYLLDGRHEGLAPDIDGKVIICDGSATPGTFTTVRVLQASTHDLVATMDLERDLDDEDLVAIDLENRPAPRLGQ